MYRKGASRVTGLVARGVYGLPPHDVWAGQHCPGAPTTPEKTWFQTPLVQESSLLFLTRNCCCDPLITILPSNSESAINPPLAKDGPEQKSKRVVNPLTCTRRIGAACDTAQNSATPPQPSAEFATKLIVRFDSERQKLSRAMQLFAPKHWLETLMAPLMTTSPGETPRPATL